MKKTLTEGELAEDKKEKKFFLYFIEEGCHNRPWLLVLCQKYQKVLKDLNPNYTIEVEDISKF